MSKEKIKIAGAGLAGLTAALNLAKAGYRVEVFEATKETGSRFKGDLQGIENWSFARDALDFLKEANIELNFNYKGVNQLSVWGPGGIKENITFPHPAFYLVRRGPQKGCLDYCLKEQAESARNIKIFYNHPAKPQEVDIVATGPVFNDPYVDGVALGYTFNTDLEGLTVMIAGDEYALDGYSYFLVWDRYGVIATGVFGRSYEKLKKCRKRTLELCKKHKKFNMENIKPFTGTGNFFLPKIPKDRKIYIGEAGGFQDFLFGFGMRYAFLTGYLAAQSIIKRQDFYKLCQESIFPKMRVSVVNRLLYKVLDYKWLIKKLTKVSDPLKAARREYNPSLGKKILFPIAKILQWKNIRDPRVDI